MSRGRSLENIKQRISEMKISIDETDEREANAKEELVIVVERQLKSETEARSLQNRIETLKAELARVNGRATDILNQLDQNAQRSEESESNRKRLEDKEEEGFEMTKEIEDNAKFMKYDLEEKENRYKEASLREKALVNDLKRVEDNLERFLQKEVEFKKQYQDFMGTTNSLESNVNILNEKEDELQEKVAFLDDQIKQVTALEEEKASKIKTCERLKERLVDEIRREKEKMTEIEKQFEEIEQGL
jgi:chromosome segregation ATPase